MSALPEWNGGRPGTPITFESWDKDFRGLLIKPGQRVCVRASDGQRMVFDRDHLVKALAFLETQKPEAERKTWCATCGQRTCLEAAE